jgi:hypothetical protein
MEISRNDTFACFTWRGLSTGQYSFFKDQDEVLLFKLQNSPLIFTTFFYEYIPFKNENVILVFSLTQAGSDVIISTTVLDKDNENSVLFERRIIDTPAVEPSMPNRSVKGLLTGPDTGVPHTGSANVSLALWNYTTTGSPDPVWIVYDNFEIFEYPTPLLAIQQTPSTDQVILTWPATTVSFQMEGASSLEGPWESVTNSFTNEGGECRMELTTSDTTKFFRLQRSELD